jgi:hypothetical protein
MPDSGRPPTGLWWENFLGVTLTIGDIDLRVAWEVDNLVRLSNLVGGLIVDENSGRSGALEEPVEDGLVLGVTEELLNTK